MDNNNKDIIHRIGHSMNWLSTHPLLYHIIQSPHYYLTWCPSDPCILSLLSQATIWPPISFDWLLIVVDGCNGHRGSNRQELIIVHTKHPKHTNMEGKTIHCGCTRRRRKTIYHNNRPSGTVNTLLLALVPIAHAVTTLPRLLHYIPRQKCILVLPLCRDTRFLYFYSASVHVLLWGPPAGFWLNARHHFLEPSDWRGSVVKRQGLLLW